MVPAQLEGGFGIILISQAEPLLGSLKFRAAREELGWARPWSTLAAPGAHTNPCCHCLVTVGTCPFPPSTCAGAGCPGKVWLEAQRQCLLWPCALAFLGSIGTFQPQRPPRAVFPRSLPSALPMVLWAPGSQVWALGACRKSPLAAPWGCSVRTSEIQSWGRMVALPLMQPGKGSVLLLREGDRI